MPMPSEEELLSCWYRKLQTEWLPNWVDMPPDLFRWWNLIVVALDDATD